MKPSHLLKMAGLAAVAAFADIPESRAEIVLSNLNVTPAGGSPVGNLSGTNLWWGSRFITDNSASAFQLESVTLEMVAPEGFINPTGGFFVAIYSDLGNAPGIKLGENLVGTDNPATAGDYTYQASGQTLFATTSYWLVAGVTLGETGLYSWNAASTDDSDGIWTIPDTATHIHSLFGGSGGTDWDVAFPGSPRVFSIEADAIPEPAAAQVLLFGGGAVLIAMVCRSRRRFAFAKFSAN